METFSIAWDTSLQIHVPTDRLARVYAYDILGSMIAIPVGQSAMCPVAEVVGTDTVLIGAAVVITLAAIAGLLNPSVRNLRRPPASPDQPLTQPAPARV